MLETQVHLLIEGKKINFFICKEFSTDFTYLNIVCTKEFVEEGCTVQSFCVFLNCASINVLLIRLISPRALSYFLKEHLTLCTLLCLDKISSDSNTLP